LDVHEKFDDCVHGRKSVGKEDETDYNGELLVEAERFVERTIVNEDGEEGKYVEEVRLSDISTYYMAKARDLLTWEIPKSLVV
jgi:hypothetical protein